MGGSDILSRIDDTLTFYSAGLGVDLEVPVEPSGLDRPDVDLDSSEDWRAAQRHGHVVAGERVHYHDLTGDEREAVHTWVREHGLEPSNVPIDGLLGYDAGTGEWRIRVYRRRDGKLYVGDGGEAAAIVVRRVQRRPLQWPVYGEPILMTARITCTG